MKIMTILLLVFFATFGLCDHHNGFKVGRNLASTTTKTVDPCSNPFTSSLVQERVTILKVPLINSSNKYCVPEWNTFGTCCDSSSLVAMQNTENIAIKTDSDYLSQYVSTMTEFTGRMQAIFLSSLANKYYPEIAKLTSDQRRQVWNNVLGIYVRLVDESPSTLATTCWTNTQKIRGSSLCSICSGRSNVFFNSNGKFNVDLNTCKASIDSCGNFYKSVKSILIILEELLPQIVKYGLSKLLGTELTGLHTNLNLLMPPSSLITSISTYQSSKSSSAATSVCSQILSVRKQTYIQLLQQELSKTSSSRLLLEQASNWISENRYLETSDVFTSDSQILQCTIDNGATIAEQKVNQRPMIGSLAFP